MSQSSIDYRISPRKSARTPKKKRRSESPPLLSSISKKAKTEKIEDARASSEGSSSQDVPQDEQEQEIVIPSMTTSGELLIPSCTSRTSTPAEEEIYSSLPPDIAIEQIVRVTRSCVTGEKLLVRRLAEGRLLIMSITAQEANSENETNYHTRSSCQCVVCERVIDPTEMFLNFPDDLDRRRIWGNLLGFRYQDMLRVKSRMVTIGAICTDHFAEECFRMYNFNKAAIESLGVPKHLSPVKSPMKRKPWLCTVCTFASYSPFTTQQHVLTKHLDSDQPARITADGFMCPFCRKCTYGYKTLGGFKRHIEARPVEHCHLRRVYDVSREMCRSHYLEPCTEWPSWTADNVALAYYGFIPPKPPPPRKRPLTAPASPAKNAVTGDRSQSTTTTPFKEDQPPPLYREESESPVKQQTMKEDEHDGGTTLADVLALATAVANSSEDPTLEDRVAAEPLNPAQLAGKWLSNTTTIRVTQRQVEAAEARQRLFGDAIPNDNIYIQQQLPMRRREGRLIGSAHQRLIHVAADLSSDLAAKRPLFNQGSGMSVPQRPRVAILRPKGPGHSS